MLSHMHPQLAEFFHYRLAQQELMKELGESGAASSASAWAAPSWTWPR